MLGLVCLRIDERLEVLRTAKPVHIVVVNPDSSGFVRKGRPLPTHRMPGVNPRRASTLNLDHRNHQKLQEQFANDPVSSIYENIVKARRASQVSSDHSENGASNDTTESLANQTTLSDDRLVPNDGPSSVGHPSAINNGFRQPPSSSVDKTTHTNSLHSKVRRDYTPSTTVAARKTSQRDQVVPTSSLASSHRHSSVPHMLHCMAEPALDEDRGRSATAASYYASNNSPYTLESQLEGQVSGSSPKPTTQHVQGVWLPSNRAGAKLSGPATFSSSVGNSARSSPQPSLQDNLSRLIGDLEKPINLSIGPASPSDSSSAAAVAHQPATYPLSSRQQYNYPYKASPRPQPVGAAAATTDHEPKREFSAALPGKKDTAALDEEWQGLVQRARSSPTDLNNEEDDELAQQLEHTIALLNQERELNASLRMENSELRGENTQLRRDMETARQNMSNFIPVINKL
jgi:hypothetical protein